MYLKTYIKIVYDGHINNHNNGGDIHTQTLHTHTHPSLA